MTTCTTTYEQVRKLYLVDRLPTKDIIEQLKHRVTHWTVRDHVRRVIAEAKERGEEIPMRRPHTGGFKKLYDTTPLSPDHRTIGVKLGLFREVNKKMTPKDFCAKYEFVSWTRLRQMELGLHDFSLRETQKIASILGVTVEELLRPSGSAYVSNH